MIILPLLALKLEYAPFSMESLIAVSDAIASSETFVHEASGLHGAFAPYGSEEIRHVLHYRSGGSVM